jgi:CRISPR-associated endonuclease Csn1
MTNCKKYTLGLDLGVQSVGWAIVPDEISDEFPIKLGVRCFDSGTGTESEIEQGKDESRNKTRRDARLIRRQQWRRKRKNIKLLNLLKRNGLLPAGMTDTSEDRNTYFKSFDKQQCEKYLKAGDLQSAQLLPYRLRALALDEKLELHSLGRALYHLGQRRGFLSNKKANKDKDEKKQKKSPVKEEISELYEEIQRYNARTLGEFFCKIDPENDDRRIRHRYTHRKMFIEEFNAICDAQQKYYSDLFNKKVIVDSGKTKKQNNPPKEKTLRDAIFHCLFFQRPLKSQKGLIGRCDLEPSKRRAPIASLEFQRFRYWQKLFDLEYKNEDGLMVPLTKEQRELLAKELEQTEKLTYSQMRKLLGFKQPRRSKEEKAKDEEDNVRQIYSFNFEKQQDEDKENKGDLKGNTTAAKIREIIGEQWDNMAKEQQSALVDEMLQFANEEALARRLVKAWKFDITTATELAAIDFESDYCSLSRLAICKILPYMQEKQIRYATARKNIYGEILDKRQEKFFDFLPPIHDAPNAVRGSAMRNPVVMRTLTEMRKVVNAIIRKYGKPERIRIELPREMKKGRKVCKAITALQGEREKERKIACNFLKENNLERSENNILKYRLWKECNERCPYSQKTISYDLLFGNHPQFQIEHIRPFSRTLDNSFDNKTLCHVDWNQRKGNKNPYEAFAETKEWYAMIESVRHFRGKHKEEKLKRFLEETIPDDIHPGNHMSNTGHISKLATVYVNLLYGNNKDEEEKINDNYEKIEKRKVQTVSGTITSWLRQLWGLNGKGIYGQKYIPNSQENSEEPWKLSRKNRADSRHHAIDALVIALCEVKYIQQLAKAAEKVSDEIYNNPKHEGKSIDDMGRIMYNEGLKQLFQVRYFYQRPFDWKQIRDIVDEINISFRCDRRTSGGFHKETNYSKPIQGFDKTGKQVEYRHVRKPIASMTENEINNIVDDRIREIVQQKLKAVGGISKIKLLAEKEHCPHFITRDGRVILIKKARYRQNISLLPVGKGASERFVAAGINHHMEIFSVLDEKGNEIDLDWKVVSLFEAYQRKKLKQPIISPDNGLMTRLKFSLAKGASVLATVDGEDVLLKVCKISNGDLSLCENRDARVEKERKKTGDFQKYRIQSIRTLKQMKLRKVTVDLLGNIHPAND